ncbi:MAG: N-ethylammeline chlorohydrolase [Archaeoglobales archaeon]|nr:MAG: N-ethylammeline chlorohydrolase [Archaeoglobales archaeon]
MDIVIRDGLCFVDGRFVRANVGVKGGRIAYVGKDDLKGEIVIDASEKIVIPGIFNAHTHLAMTLFRGYAEDLPLKEWLEEKIWKVEGLLEPRDVYWGSLLGILEMLKTGTTAFSDLYIHMDEVAKAVNESGIRGVLSYGMADRGDELKAKREIEIGLRFIKRWNGKKIKTIFGPHAPYTCTPDFLKRVKEIANEMGKHVHIHISETRWEVEYVKSKYGKTPVRLLDDIGFLDDKTVVAHAIWIDDEEMRILKDRGVSVVHCPISNLKLASGIARVKDMHDLGINVCLGTDGASSNNTYNMFEEMKMTSLLQKVITSRADALKAGDVLKMATENGYRAYGLRGGRIEEGYLADIVLIDRKRENYTPIYNPLHSIVYASYGCEVTHVIVDGEIVVDDGIVITLDEDRIIDRVEGLKKKFLI